jgi:uncharacterized membrane protein
MNFSTLLVLTALGPTVTHTQLKPTLDKHCTSCHSASWKDKNWTDYPTAKKHCSKFMDRVVVRKDMPPGNMTEMTEAERGLFKDWVNGGCKK